MRRDFTIQKRLILSLLVLLIGADVALGVYSWNLASTQSAQQELGIMMRNRDLLKKDIQRANEIRSHIPAIQKDCDVFEQSLFPETTGYSTVTAELSALAAKSGLRLDSPREESQSQSRSNRPLSHSCCAPSRAGVAFGARPAQAPTPG